MSSNEDWCVKIGVVFHALYFENEVGDPQFSCISDLRNLLSDCSHSMKKNLYWRSFSRDCPYLRKYGNQSVFRCLFANKTIYLKVRKVHKNSKFPDSTYLNICTDFSKPCIQKKDGPCAKYPQPQVIYKHQNFVSSGLPGAIWESHF